MPPQHVKLCVAKRLAWKGLTGHPRETADIARRPGHDTRVARRHVEIFLYVDQHDEPIAISDRFSVYKVVEPIVGTAWETHPQWTIDACKARAEPIIGEGQLQPYYAVN